MRARILEHARACALVVGVLASISHPKPFVSRKPPHERVEPSSETCIAKAG